MTTKWKLGSTSTTKLLNNMGNVDLEFKSTEDAVYYYDNLKTVATKAMRYEAITTGFLIGAAVYAGTTIGIAVYKTIKRRKAEKENKEA